MQHPLSLKNTTSFSIYTFIYEIFYSGTTILPATAHAAAAFGEAR